MNSMRRLQIGFALGILSLLMGCSRQPSLVGNWSIEFPGRSGASSDRQFNPDGTWDQQWYARDGSLRLSVVGTYKLDGRQLTMTQRALQYPDGKVRQVSVSKQLKVRWTSDDRVEFLDNGPGMAFDRSPPHA